MEKEMKIVNAIVIGRISSKKQELMGDSLDDQEKQIQQAIRRIEVSYNCKVTL